jgi:NADH-quinone oxidoreductase subunit N
VSPTFDYHALAPLFVLAGTVVVVLVADLVFPDREGWQSSRLASLGVLATMVPVITLAVDGDDRSLFGGAFVVNNYSLALAGFFLVVGYITVLVSVDYVGEGDYYQGEFYFLILSSLLGMVAMASARDLISIFVALELISIPTFVLAGWRKHDTKSNEAAIKYYLIGVLSSAVMLYGMSLIFGLSGGKVLLTDIADFAASADAPPLFPVAIFLTLVGFAFKVSAVPFHFWAPDTYEGAPTPVTAFLSVASKAGGFVAILSIVYFGFFQANDSWEPVMWALAAASMTIGNLTALRQTNIVRMLAYSSVAQGGFILVPLAVAQDAPVASFEAVVVYLLIYGAMNLGAFAVVIAVARRTRSGEIASYAGLGQTAPALGLLMTVFLMSLAGIPPLAGWFAKFVMFRAVFEAGGAAAVTLGVIAAVNSVIAFFYYAAVARRIWFEEPETELTGTARVPTALTVALGITAAVVVVIGVYPQLFARIGELAAQG